MQKKKPCILAFFLLLALVLTGCGDGGFLSPQAQFGRNAWYFMARASLHSGTEDEAVTYLERGAQKSEGFFAQKCLEELSRFGSVRQRIATAQELYKRFPSNTSLLRFCQELLTGEEYEQLIAVTANLTGDIPAELTYLRLVALSNRGKQGFAGELEDWFFHEDITGFHRKYFDAFKDTAIARLLAEDTIQGVEFRLAVQRRDYGQAIQIVSRLLQEQASASQWLSQQSEKMLSDIGRTFLYGTPQVTEAAQFLESTVKGLDRSSPEYTPFYLNFYAARLYDRGLGTGNKKALEGFKAAMETAPTPANYDNALWYYLSAQLKISVEAAETALREYIATLHDPSYYSDFFETLALRYFTKHDWTGMLRVYGIIKDYADSETLSRYSYLCGRLVQLGLIDLGDFSQSDVQAILSVPQADDGSRQSATSTGKSDEEDSPSMREEVSRALFSTAYREGGDLYYRLMAAVQLDYSPAVVRQTIYKSRILDDFQPDANLEKLLEGFIVFDLPEHIYPLWRENSSVISLEMAQRAAAYLSLYGVELYSAQGLRLMANAIFQPDSQTTEEMYRLAYPRLYSAEIAAAAQEYDLPEYLLLGLIRSESFFEAGVSSHAGAVGLAQLMPSTAGDIARKLRVSEYDLTDPATSISFGSFYLAELVGRLDNSIIEALYSYNAGITNLRNWKKVFPDLPEDLILELIPFAETRSYGRKIVSAAAVYGDLYYGRAHTDVVAEIMFEGEAN